MQINSSFNLNKYLEDYDSIRAARARLGEEFRQSYSASLQLNSIPPRYQGKTFTDFKVNFQEQTKVKKICQIYTQTFRERSKEGNSLLFHGLSGTGKTFLSLIINQELTKNGFIIHYESSLQFLRLLHGKNFATPLNFNDVLAKYIEADLLIMDEMTEGSCRDGSLSPSEKQMLSTIVDARYQRSKPILGISNLTKMQIQTRLGSSIFERIIHHGVTLAFNWKSYRV